MNNNRIYIETYGCQMNFADTELVMGILSHQGYELAKNIDDANVILLNTCSIRDNAEQKIYNRLEHLKAYKKNNRSTIVGILGCMAERLRKSLIEEEKIVDLVVGPDEYRRLPEFIDSAFGGDKGIGVKLSRTETYDDITPYREDGLSAWISVMRGCDKFCTFCVVPFTRGRERSRSLESIVDEVQQLSERGFREITLLGQNVNSYIDQGKDFADLLAASAIIDRSVRIRFTTSHPQDLSEKLLHVIAEHSNICSYVHLPLQSGSNRILELMKRTYSVEHYLDLIKQARKIIPSVSFSTDIIAGFPTETEEDHSMTLKVMQEVRYDGAYMFKYSPREGTKAYSMNDDVTEEVKAKRLNDIIEVQQKISFEINKQLVGNEEIILIEGSSKKSDDFLAGRTDSNKIVIVPRSDGIFAGDYIKVKVNNATSATLFADFVEVINPAKVKVLKTA